MILSDPHTPLPSPSTRLDLMFIGFVKGWIVEMLPPVSFTAPILQ